MKKQISILAIAVVSLLMFNSYTGGAPSNVSGSPGDNNKTCASTSCHNTTAQSVANMISTDIPSTGWEAGKTYNITFSISESGINKFGFQVSSEDANNAKKGTFKATTATKILTGGTHITHISSSTGGTGTKAWTFQWVAPAKGTGKITFYGAGNAANGNGSGRLGDIIKKSSHGVIEKDLTSSVNGYSNLEVVKVFPTPTHSLLNVNGVEQGSYKIYDLAGFTHLQGDFVNSENILDVSSLQNGVYFLYSENSNLVQKIIKQ